MTRFPKKRNSKKEVLKSMRVARDQDVKWEKGRAFGLIYHINEEIDSLLKDAFMMFFSENGLNPTAFPACENLKPK